MGSQSPPYRNGLCIAMPQSKDDDDAAFLDDRSAAEALRAARDPEVLRKREEVERWLGGTALAETPDRPLSLVAPSLDDPVIDSAPEDVAEGELTAQSSSDASQEELALGAPSTPSSPWEEPEIAVHIRPLEAPLDPPFVLDDKRISAERSAFDSDTEDEDEEEDKLLGQIRISKFNRLRRALRSSMSVPNIVAARRSLIETTGTSSVGTSPESVCSLRARQTTTSTTSPPRNPYILKLATDVAALSPVPSSPAAVDDPACQADTAAQSPATPATPASPRARETRSFIFEMSKASLALDTPPPPPLPDTSRCCGPPKMPLPPTPPLASTPSLPLRPALAHETGAAGWRWREDVLVHDRMTVVDPGVSMARLQETMAKLAAHAPHAQRADSVPRRHGPAAEPPAAARGAPVSASSAANRHGVVVLACEPAATARPASADEAARPPPVPSKPGHMRRPSAPLLPLFDFERPGGRGLDLRELPVRTASLRRAGAGEPRDPAAERPTAAPPVPAKGPATPRRASAEDAPVSSHFSPESPPLAQKAPRASRVRRLLGVRTDLIRGLRGSLGS